MIIGSNLCRALLSLVALSIACAGCDDNNETGLPDEQYRLKKIVAMRRLTETQYRNSIADIFGPDIIVAGRFEPVVRPTDHLIATGSYTSEISPAGLEQFDQIARSIAAQVFGEDRRALYVSCVPKDATDSDDACASEVLSPIGRYLFRRPLLEEEKTAYVHMANGAAAQAKSFYKGLELALAAMLISPKFLYVIESAEPDPKRTGAMRLDNYARAARLSYLFWNTTPNDELLNLAEQGKLTNRKHLEKIARKMVASPRLKDGVRAFFSDMLIFEKFEELAKDPVIYPRFSSKIGEALPEQILLMIVDQLVTRGNAYQSIFTTNRTFLNRPLGPLYDAPVASTRGWVPYAFPEDSPRAAGILGHAGFLALYSHSGRSSPTLRGRAVRELLLCQEVPDPPGNVDFTVIQDTTNETYKTARARLTAHRTDPTCSGCHKITDPIGLSLERFDGIGAFREQENGIEIDVSATMDDIDYVGAIGLGEVLANHSAATACVVSRAIEYALGTTMHIDRNLTETIEARFATDGYRISSLFLQVSTMPEAYQVPNDQVQAKLTNSLEIMSGEAKK